MTARRLRLARVLEKGSDMPLIKTLKCGAMKAGSREPEALQSKSGMRLQAHICDSVSPAPAVHEGCKRRDVTIVATTRS
jgi:hypothetical protein